MDAQTVGSFFNTFKRFIDKLENLAIPGTLPEHEFLRIGLQGHIPDILSVLFFFPAVSFGSLDCIRQSGPFLQQLALEIFQVLGVHHQSFMFRL
jgi:hypothetical protein